MNKAQVNLQQLDAQIEARVQALRSQHSWFPCGRGCDQCCRQLAHPPELSAAEWERVDAAVAKLPDVIRVEVEEKIDQLVEQIAERKTLTSVVCPYLDEREGACLIYADRPIACRTYGFYVARDHDQYCQKIEAEVIAREGEAIVWGNAEIISKEVERMSGTPISFEQHYCPAS